MREPDPKPHPLEGARLKDRRAYEQLQALQLAVKAFLERQPYAAYVEIDAEDGQINFGIDVREKPDPMWGVLIGEIVHDFHSALDHVAWQLVIRDGGVPNDRTQFPIFLDPAKFDLETTARGKMHGMMEGMAPESIAILKAVQPFAAGDRQSALWQLRELSIFDKHKSLHVTAGIIDRVRVLFKPLVKGGEFTPGAQGDMDWGPFEEDTVIFRYKAPPGVLNPEGVDVDPPPSYQVVFGKESPIRGVPVIEGLALMGHSVRNIIAGISKERFPT